MEELRKVVLDNFGVRLSDQEIRGFFLRHKPEIRSDGTLDTSKILEEIKIMVSSQHAQSKKPTPYDTTANLNTYNEIMKLIRSKLSIKSANFRSQNFFQKAFVIFGNNRGTELTRAQLKLNLEHRLSIRLTDAQIDKVFEKLDSECSGSVKIFKLVQALVKLDSEDNQMSINLESLSKTNNTSKVNVAGDNVKVTYDKTIMGLMPPDVAHTKRVSVDELESQIRDKIFERTHIGSNMLQSLVRAFGDDRDTKHRGISLQQLCHTLWNRFHMNVHFDDIMALYRRLDPQNSGSISLEKFIEGIVKKHSLNEPLIDDLSASRNNKNVAFVTSAKNQTIEGFLTFLRRMIREMTNRESRAPHYVLHSVNRMTCNQAKEFFEKRLNVRVEDGMLNMLLKEFPSNGLIDMKKIILNAMEHEEYGSLGKDLTLINGAAVTVDELPDSLKGIRYTVQEVEDILYQKICERTRNDNSLSTLYKIFRCNNTDTRNINKSEMMSVFAKFDILVHPDDFDAFFKKHDRGDGKIPLGAFFRHLLPKNDSDGNPLVPKNNDVMDIENSVANVLGTLTGKRREVSGLQGSFAVTQRSNGTSVTSAELYKSLNLNAQKVETNQITNNGNEDFQYQLQRSQEMSRNHNEQSQSQQTNTQPNQSSVNNVHQIHHNPLLLQQESVPKNNHDIDVALVAKLLQQYRDEQAKQSKRPSSAPSKLVRPEYRQSTSEFSNLYNIDGDSHSAQNPMMMFGAVSGNNNHGVVVPQIPNFQAVHENNTDNNNNNNNYNVNSPKPTRPPSAPSSRPQSARSASQGYRLTGAQNTSRSDTNCSISSTNRSMSPRSHSFTYTGQKRSTIIDPYHPFLQEKYKVSKGNTTTSHEDYGLFVRGFQRERKAREIRGSDKNNTKYHFDESSPVNASATMTSNMASSNSPRRPNSSGSNYSPHITVRIPVLSDSKQKHQ